MHTQQRDGRTDGRLAGWLLLLRTCNGGGGSIEVKKKNAAAATHSLRWKQSSFFFFHLSLFWSGVLSSSLLRSTRPATKRRRKEEGGRTVFTLISPPSLFCCMKGRLLPPFLCTGKRKEFEYYDERRAIIRLAKNQFWKGHPVCLLPVLHRMLRHPRPISFPSLLPFLTAWGALGASSSSYSNFCVQLFLPNPRTFPSFLTLPLHTRATP